MNPSCQTDINSGECQKWMNEVCVRCKELFAEQASDKWAAWWHDPTPAVYKDVPEMSVHDCNKLKRLLEQQVAAVNGPQSLKLTQFTWWQKTMLIVTYVIIMALMALICCFWKREAGNARAVQYASPLNHDHPPSLPSARGSSSSPLPPKDAEKRDKPRQNLKNWMRNRCRQFFVHNEATLRRQNARYREQEQFRNAYNQKKIERWTKGPEEVENKRRKQRPIQTEQKRKDKKNNDLAQLNVESQDAK